MNGACYIITISSGNGCKNETEGKNIILIMDDCVINKLNCCQFCNMYMFVLPSNLHCSATFEDV